MRAIRRSASLGLSAACFALLVSCAPSKDNLVVVLPPSDGHIGGVVVHGAGGATVLDQPYAAVGAAAGSRDVVPVSVSGTEVAQIFAPALAARPIPPQKFTLYFKSDTDMLTPQSQTAFEQVFGEIARRKAAEIVVTGHTDTFGDSTYNDQLSLKRARAVREMFIARGLPADSVLAVGRGDRELLVPTGDGVHEPRNRRVVITVR